MKTTLTREDINTRNVGKIANNASWIKAEIISLQYAKGYVELKLRNGLFTVIELKDEVTAEVRIASFGGFKSVINVSEVEELINKLSN